VSSSTSTLCTVSLTLMEIVTSVSVHPRLRRSHSRKNGHVRRFSELLTEAQPRSLFNDCHEVSLNCRLRFAQCPKSARDALAVSPGLNRPDGEMPQRSASDL